MREFLDDLMKHGYAQGQFLGLLNLMIGRRIAKADGTVISVGLTWREVASWLKKVRWDKDAVAELGLTPADMPPRDRERYWYSAIAQANVGSPQAVAAGDRLAEQLAKVGYVIK